MFLRFLLFSVLSFALTAPAAQKPAAEIVVVDELLFDLNGEGKTNYDFKIFEEIIKPLERYFAPSVVKSFQDKAEFYVFSCLALKEAEQLDIQADPEVVERFLQTYRFPENGKKAEVVKSEIEKLFRVAELVTIKERQLSSRQAITAWLVVLKRKYSLGWKANDFKSRTAFGI